MLNKHLTLTLKYQNTNVDIKWEDPNNDTNIGSIRHM
jgi:hypothetical protein